MIDTASSSVRGVFNGYSRGSVGALRGRQDAAGTGLATILIAIIYNGSGGIKLEASPKRSMTYRTTFDEGENNDTPPTKIEL